MRLRGHTALVAGAGSDLRHGIAVKYATEGLVGIAADTDLARTRATDGLIGAINDQTVDRSFSPEHQSNQVDVASGASVEQLADGALKPDIIADCAGINAKVPFLEVALMSWLAS